MTVRLANLGDAMLGLVAADAEQALLRTIATKTATFA
jgi:hypothetical protein